MELVIFLGALVALVVLLVVQRPRYVVTPDTTVWLDDLREDGEP